MSGREQCAGIVPWLQQEEIGLRCLLNESCLEAEALWRNIFTEDTEAFTAYYFKEKARHNRGLVLEGREGIRSMLYLTPEPLYVMGEKTASAYIVGVATKEEYRHRGYMAFLLQEAMHMLYGEKIPFVFLMPASPDIYTPFGFTWIYDRPKWQTDSLKREVMMELSQKDADRLAAFAQEFLRREKKVYICHDAAYYIQQAAELKAQDGCIYGYEKEGILQGICMYAQEGGCPEITEVLAAAETEGEFILRRTEKTPVIMARIVCAGQMLSFLRSWEPAEFVLDLSDPLVAENNGKFRCRVDRDRAAAERCLQECHADVHMDITELTAFVFGYQRPENGVLTQIQPCSPVWINEIV